MSENASRAKLNAQLNELLNAHVLKQKSLGRKGVTKERVLEELCRSGLEYQQMVRNKDANVGDYRKDGLGVYHPHHPVIDQHLAKSRLELKIWQDALGEKEDRLLKKEEVLLQKEGILNQKEHHLEGRYEKELLTREVNIAHRENMNEDSGPSKKYLEERVKQQKEIIESLQKEIKELREERRELMREIKRSLKTIVNNTKTNVWTDTILPIINPAISLYLVTQLNKQPAQKSYQDLESILSGIMQFVPADQREVLQKAVSDALKFSQESKADGSSSSFGKKKEKPGQEKGQEPEGKE